MAKSEQLTRLFKALTHTARLEILDILRGGEQCVCHMEAHLGYRQAYISQQLAVLREAGLIEDRRDGWNVYYRVIDRRVYDLVDEARAMVGVAGTTHRRLNRKIVACPCPKCAPQAGEAGAVTVPLREIRMQDAVTPG